jgi:uncharacterized protein YndB with AHSA1/START domain
MKRANETTESILIECDLPDSPQKVWRALTEPQWLGKWLMPCDLRVEVGARFHFWPADGERGENSERSQGGERSDTPIDCEVIDVEPNRRLRWLQRERDEGRASVESVVTLEISSIPNGGTRLRLLHDGFTRVSSQVVPESLSPKASATIIEFKPRAASSRSCHRRTVASSRPVALRRRAA